MARTIFDSFLDNSNNFGTGLANGLDLDPTSFTNSPDITSLVEDSTSITEVLTADPAISSFYNNDALATPLFESDIGMSGFADDSNAMQLLTQSTAGYTKAGLIENAQTKIENSATAVTEFNNSTTAGSQNATFDLRTVDDLSNPSSAIYLEDITIPQSSVGGSPAILKIDGVEVANQNPPINFTFEGFVNDVEAAQAADNNSNFNDGQITYNYIPIP